MSEREKFEAWFKKYDVNYIFSMNYSHGRYDDHVTQAMWQTWQAAKKDATNQASINNPKT